jgi:hypothetical protein
MPPEMMGGMWVRVLPREVPTVVPIDVPTSRALSSIGRAVDF